MSQDTTTPLPFDRRRRLEVWVPVFVLAAAILAVFRAYIVQPFEVPFSVSSDIMRHYLPFKDTLYALSHQIHGIPGWDPTSQGGRPMSADPGVAAFYPLALPFYFLPPKYLFGMFFLVHILIGATLTFLLLRVNRASCAAAACGTMAYSLNLKLVATYYAGFSTMIPAQAWLPGAFLSIHFLRAEDKHGVRLAAMAGLGMVLALQVLAGDTQLMAYTMLFLVPYALLVPQNGLRPALPRTPAPLSATATLWWILLALGFAMLVALPLVPPAFSLANVSARADGLPLPIATMMSLPPAQIPAMFLPALSGSEIQRTFQLEEPFWEIAFYPGLAVWLLAALAVARFRKDRRVIPLAVLAYFALFVALGRYGPIYPVLYYLIPGLGHFRGPARVLPVLALFLSLLAAIGLDRLPEETLTRRRLLTLLMGVLVALGTLGFAYVLLNADPISRAYQAGNQSLIPNPSAGRVAFGALLLGIARATLVVATIAAALNWKRLLAWNGRELKFVVMIVLAMDLVAVSYRLPRTAKAADLLPPNPVAVALRPENTKVGHWEPPGRILDLAGVLTDAVSASHGLYTINGMNPLVLERSYLFSRYVAGEPPVRPTDRSVYGVLIQSLEHPRLLDLLRVTHIVTEDPHPIPGYAQTLRFENVRVFHQFLGISRYPTVFVYEREATLPIGWVVHAIEASPASVAQTLQRLEEIDIFREALVELDGLGTASEAAAKLIGPLLTRTSAAPAREGRDLSLCPSPARMMDFGPDEIVLDVEVPVEGGLLVMSEVVSPGWHAEVDGEPYPVLTANYLLRSVALPGGRHRVRWWYEHLAGLTP